MPEPCCNGSNVSALRKQGIRRNATDCFDWQWVNRFWIFLPSSSLRHTLIVTLVISWKLNVEQDTLVLIPTCSDILFSTVLIWDHPPPLQLCKQYLWLCVISLKIAWSWSKSVTSMTFFSFLFQSTLSDCSPGSLSWSLCWLLQFPQPSRAFLLYPFHLLQIVRHFVRPC